LNALGACHQPVSIYGLMFDPASAALLQAHPHISFKGSADPVDALPRLNQRTKVTLDVVTAHFPTGITAKIAGCFATGGLCLFNAKSAFREAFGSAADQVMYRDFEDMNAKLDHLLTRDRERLELADFFKAEILRKYTYTNLVAELVAWVKETVPQRAA
jgi:spore maturation protein CgeB